MVAGSRAHSGSGIRVLYSKTKIPKYYQPAKPLTQPDVRPGKEP